MGSRSEPRKSYASLGVIESPKEEEIAIVDKSDYNSLETDSAGDDCIVAFTRASRMMVEIPGGRTLTFDGAGSEVKVSRREAEYLLNIKKGRSCCGGQQSSPLFILVGGKLWV